MICDLDTKWYLNVLCLPKKRSNTRPDLKKCDKHPKSGIAAQINLPKLELKNEAKWPHKNVHKNGYGHKYWNLTRLYTLLWKCQAQFGPILLKIGLSVQTHIQTKGGSVRNNMALLIFPNNLHILPCRYGWRDLFFSTVWDTVWNILPSLGYFRSLLIPHFWGIKGAFCEAILFTTNLVPSTSGYLVCRVWKRTYSET